ncbi:sodium- and chloride-dependent GABA transporter 3-like [Haliotis asinina]|uniref:sodium- and chloride-dependent GABA transporter 3-like n=1 Tax=Haliotis asinina TaxID=109174 RepID=UPI003531865E
MEHEKWSSQVDYIMTVLGYSIGVGSMWKFPYMCMRNGGGAFLIPFVVFMIIGTVPCVFLEMVIGQFSQSGAVKVWNLCPPFKGMGIGNVLIGIFFSNYYSALFAWLIYYFYHSFSRNIPWSTCDNPWNTPSCISFINVGDDAPVNSTNVSTTVARTAHALLKSSASSNSTALANGSTPLIAVTSAEEFWTLKVLQISDGLEYLGSMRWPLVGCLAITYTLAFLCLFRGIKIAGKVVYVTVGAPYILITVFLIRGCLLPGSADGIYYYIYPHFEKLLDAKIWIEACNYALYTPGIAFGCLPTMAGHNKLNNNCLRDALVLTTAIALTTMYMGFAFFAIMGHVAYLRGVTVDSFQYSGYNLGFIAYPEAVASLPLPQLWSVLTFLNLLTLGLDSLLPSYEIALTALSDQFPSLSRRRWMNMLLVLVPSFLVGLLYMTQGGMYMLTQVEWYAFFPSIAVFGMLECFVVSWIYGTHRLQRVIKSMCGKTVPRIMTFILKFTCPGLLLIIFCYSLYSYRPPNYGDYIYPTWATGLGWMISFGSILPLPVVFIWTVYKTEGNSVREKLRKSVKPNTHWDLSSTHENSTELMF